MNSSGQIFSRRSSISPVLRISSRLLREGVRPTLASCGHHRPSARPWNSSPVVGHHTGNISPAISGQHPSSEFHNSKIISGRSSSSRDLVRLQPHSIFFSAQLTNDLIQPQPVPRAAIMTHVSIAARNQQDRPDTTKKKNPAIVHPTRPIASRWKALAMGGPSEAREFITSHRQIPSP
ncbi:cyclophilin-like peptidyl-prolyl cis-transisomerase family protein [Striga asiatica]|uniref:Cyclophilin-like peptidyl-prolyl cis-transisomerase family protein n=1 Tax=Striga asiatica TaxID=4170 RepID=A0A5A7RKA0_STRAF|nr:cyclophilin-like peptidyl-prolyl cis-transisomerase family protein [Striga asiatica]